MLLAFVGGVPGGMELVVMFVVLLLQLGLPLAVLALAYLWLKRRTDTSDIEARLDDIESRLAAIETHLDESE